MLRKTLFDRRSLRLARLTHSGLPFMLLKLLENLIQCRFLSFGGGVSRLALAWACVTTLRVVLICGCHDISHIHTPYTITELANLVTFTQSPLSPTVIL